MTISPREREVLDIVGRCQAVGRHVLEEFLEKRIPPDELRVVIDSLHRKHLVTVMPAVRSESIAITREGQRATKR